MNLSFPHLDVPIHYFAASIALGIVTIVFISHYKGLIPWNFFTCQAGSVISTFKSKDEIMGTSTLLSVKRKYCDFTNFSSLLDWQQSFSFHLFIEN